MTLVPEPIPATFATATEMSQFFIQRHHGDADAAAKDMETLLRRNKRLYDKLIDELVQIAVHEKLRLHFAGLG